MELPKSLIMTSYIKEEKNLAVRIRLKRIGKKKQPYYRIIIADIRSPRDGKFIETIGYYHPLAKTEEEKVKISKEKLEEWLKKGAQPSDTVNNLIKSIR